MREMLRSIAFCAFACAAVAVFSLLVLGRAQTLREVNLNVRIWRDIEVTTERVLGALRDSETGERGYLLTEDPRYLEPFEKANGDVSTLTASLEHFTVSQPLQFDRARRISDLAKSKIDELSSTIEMGGEGDWQGALAQIKSGRGKALMDEIRALAGAIDADASEGARLGRDRANEATRNLVSSVVLTSGLSILLLVLLTAFARRDGRRIRESAERLSTTVASVGDAVISTDSDGRVQLMNPVAESLTGWKISEAAGKPLDAIFRIVNEQTRQPVESPHHKVLREGSVVGLANHTALISKDGKERPIEDSAAPIRGIHGEIAGVVLVFKDATERYAAEQAQRDSERRFRAAVAAMEGVLWTNSPEGEMRGEQAGWAKLTGQSLDEYQRFGWAKAVHPDDVQPTLEAWQEAVAKRTAFKFEHRALRHDGEWRTFSVRAIPVLDGHGEIREWVGVHTDVTEQRQALASLTQADQRKDEFLATLAHELRNPVAPIKHAIALLEKEGLPEEQQRWSRAVITRQVGHIERLLDDLLDSARITRGEFSLKSEWVNLETVITDALDVARPIIERKHHTLAVTLPQPPVSVLVDRVRMAQVLSNLLTNAAKYTDRDGSIHLVAQSKDDRLSISVSDSGVGLAPEAIPKIFRMFNQVESARDRAEGGLGIGLSLASKLTEMHGGRIEATSAGEGRGSKFSVILPASIVTLKTEDVVVIQNETARTNASRLILIIDDNVDAAVSLGMLLELSSNEVLLAHTGEEGLEIARQHRPAAVVIDIGLPGINGYQVAQALREESWCKNALLIALTGWGEDSDKQSAKAAGFDHHLTKPADPTEVERLIAAA